MLLFRLTALALVFASSVHAETYEVKTTGYGKANDFFDPLSGELQRYKSELSYDRFDGTDENAPLVLVGGRCFGSFVIVRGEPRGGGNCVFVDKNGDKVLQEWRLDEVDLGIGRGTYYFVGGTGAHVGISGRGYYTNEAVARTGETKTTIVGTVSWPDD
ncbi:hypothetical protein [Actibacterium mucosum]|uniref:hypothetical protein n=1 Tax=Actibacterium mucosum TaxID=1087332 RepID=UPI0012689BF6|nr:hypothetical protein [Actibacterium mucosum]